MKRIFFLLSGFFIGFSALAQDAESAKPGVVYGVITEKGITPISVNDLEQKIGDAKYEG